MKTLVKGPGFQIGPLMGVITISKTNSMHEEIKSESVEQKSAGNPIPSRHRNHQFHSFISSLHLLIYSVPTYKNSILRQYAVHQPPH